MAYLIRAAAVAALAFAAPLAAQFGSPGYQFLQAIKESKNDDVIAALDKPGQRIVDTRDPASGEAALHITVKRGDVAYTTCGVGLAAVVYGAMRLRSSLPVAHGGC